MKILHMNQFCGYFSGVEQNMHDVAEALAERGHTNILVYERDSANDSAHFARPFAQTYERKFLQASDVDSIAAMLSDIVHDEEPSVVYLHKARNLHLIEWLRGRIPCVRMVHDHDLCCPRRFKYFSVTNRPCDHAVGIWCILSMHILLKNPDGIVPVRVASLREYRKEIRLSQELDAVIVGSRWMRDELIRNGFSEDLVSVLPPMVKLEPPERVELPTDPNILYVGQIARRKGVDLLLRAVARLGCSFKLSIAGHGTRMPEMQQLAKRLGISKHVVFLGWLSRPALAEQYAASRVVVVPSRWPEPFGMIGLEAMNHARPIVAYNVGGIPDWLEDNVNGLLAERASVSDLAEKIGRLLEDYELAKRLGENGARILNERFHFENYISRLEDVFSEARRCFFKRRGSVI